MGIQINEQYEASMNGSQTGSTIKVPVDTSETQQNFFPESADTDQLVTVDLGCGFLQGQKSDGNSIGIDLNFEHGSPKTAYPIIGDVQFIPLRDEICEYIFARAILEHLPRPELCLDDMFRTMKTGAQGIILLPADSYQPRQILMRFLKEWPFSLGWVLSKLWRIQVLWRKIPGMVHVSQINPEDLENWFEVDHDNIIKNERLHKWFVHYGLFTIACKLGIIKKRLTVQEYAEVIIPIKKKDL